MDDTVAEHRETKTRTTLLSGIGGTASGAFLLVGLQRGAVKGISAVAFASELGAEEVVG